MYLFPYGCVSRPLDSNLCTSLTQTRTILTSRRRTKFIFLASLHTSGHPVVFTVALQATAPPSRARAATGYLATCGSRASPHLSRSHRRRCPRGLASFRHANGSQFEFLNLSRGGRFRMISLPAFPKKVDVTNAFLNVRLPLSIYQ